MINFQTDESGCNCDYGRVDPADARTREEDLMPGENFLRSLDPFRKEAQTRTGHYCGCPIDVQTYNQGEFYCHSSNEHAVNFLVPRSQGMLEVGLLNRKAVTSDEEFDKMKRENMVGLWRKIAE